MYDSNYVDPTFNLVDNSSAAFATSTKCILIIIVMVILVLAAGIAPAVVIIYLPTTSATNPTTTTTATFSECSSYTTINDSTRLVSASGGSACDTVTFTSNITWVRFVAPGGTQLTTSIPSSNQCGTQASGWFNGTLPSAGVSINGTVCYVWSSNCNWFNTVRVTNCGSFYVFGLISPIGCNLRYCTV